MFKLLFTFALWFAGGLLTLLAVLGLSKFSSAWVFFVALGVLIAVVSPWQKRWQQRQREHQDGLRTLNRPPR